MPSVPELAAIPQTRIVGLTGPNAAGKGEVARLLLAWGYGPVFSLSDIVREEAARQGLEPSRPNLIRIGTELRHIGGAGVLAEKLLPRLLERERAVVDSIRHPAEVEILRRLSGFVLVGITAPAEQRFQRSLGRGRPGDPTTLDEFVAREREENSSDPRAQQLDAAVKLADLELRNTEGLELLERRLKGLLASGASEAPGTPG